MTQPTKTEPEAKAQKIERDLAETRGALNQDIKALSDKLSPEQLKNQAKQAAHEVKEAAVDKLLEAKDKAADKVVEAKDKAAEKLSEAAAVTVDKIQEVKQVAGEKLAEAKEVSVEKLHEAGEAAREAYEEASYEVRRASRATLSFARDNAVPLALIGLGASWLFVNRRRPIPRGDRPVLAADYESSRTEYGAYGVPQSGADYDALRPHRYPPVARPQRQTARPYAERSSPTTHQALDAAERARGEASQLGRRVSERAAAAYDTTGRKLREGFISSRDFARDKMVRLRDGSRDMVQENPLAVGAIALATGIGIGLLLPETARENRLLGPARERVVGGVREAAHDLRDAARGVADVAKDTRSSML